MPSLLRVLNQDRSDLEIINLALEALSEVICEQDQLGEQFTEIFIKDVANVGVLLDLIEVSNGGFTHSLHEDAQSNEQPVISINVALF